MRCDLHVNHIFVFTIFLVKCSLLSGFVEVVHKCVQFFVLYFIGTIIQLRTNNKIKQLIFHMGLYYHLFVITRFFRILFEIARPFLIQKIPKLYFHTVHVSSISGQNHICSKQNRIYTFFFGFMVWWKKQEKLDEVSTRIA